MPFLTCVKRSSPRRRRRCERFMLPYDHRHRRRRRRPGQILFKESLFVFPPTLLAPGVVFVSPQNYIHNRNQKTKKPVTRIRYIISHTMARGIRKIRRYLCRRCRDPSKRSRHVLYYNVRIIHNVIIMYTFIHDIQYISDVSECDRFRYG